MGQRSAKEIAHGAGEPTLQDRCNAEWSKQVWPWVLAVSCWVFFGGVGIGIATHKFGCEFWGRGLGYGTIVAAIAFLLIWRIKRALDRSNSRRRQQGY